MSNSIIGIVFRGAFLVKAASLLPRWLETMFYADARPTVSFTKNYLKILKPLEKKKKSLSSAGELFEKDFRIFIKQESRNSPEIAHSTLTKNVISSILERDTYGKTIARAVLRPKERERIKNILGHLQFHDPLDKSVHEVMTDFVKLYGMNREALAKRLAQRSFIAAKKYNLSDSDIVRLGTYVRGLVDADIYRATLRKALKP